MSNGGAIHINIRRKCAERVAISLTNTRTNQVAQALVQPANRANARRLFTYLYGLCPIAHLATFDAARARALGMSEADRALADANFVETNVLLEGLTENLRVLILDAAQLTDFTIEKSVVGQIAQLRQFLAAATQDMLDLDPVNACSLAQKGPYFSPARLTLAKERSRKMMQLIQACALESLFGISSQVFLSKVQSVADLIDWAQKYHEALPAACLLHRFFNQEFGWCEINTPLLPDRFEKTRNQFADELLHRMLNEPGFELSPFWDGSPRLTGATARYHNHPIIKDLIEVYGLSPVVLLASRLIETAQAIALTIRVIEEGRIGQASVLDCHHETGKPYQILWTYSPKPGTSLCLTETARGLLAHALQLNEQNEVVALRITSPTEWQFAPYGAGQRLVMALSRHLSAPKGIIDRPEVERQIKTALFVLDPCVPIEFAYCDCHKI